MRSCETLELFVGQFSGDRSTSKRKVLASKFLRGTHAQGNDDAVISGSIKLKEARNGERGNIRDAY